MIRLEKKGDQYIEKANTRRRPGSQLGRRLNLLLLLLLLYSVIVMILLRIL